MCERKRKLSNLEEFVAHTEEEPAGAFVTCQNRRKEIVRSVLLPNTETTILNVPLSKEELRIIRRRLAPTLVLDRCPYCSFDPTSSTDFCEEHKPVLLEDIRRLAEKLEHYK